MRVFKPKDRSGRTYGRWYVEIRDATGRPRRLAGFTDRAATEELGRKLDRLVAQRSAGKEPSPEFSRWIEGLPPKLRERLAEIGLLDASRITASLSLTALLERFAESLRARNRTEKHVRRVTQGARAAFQCCGFHSWSDIDALRLERHLHNRRDDGLAGKTSNDILAAAKEFTRWAVVHGLATTDPLATLRPVRAFPKRERRALTWDDELPRLLRAAAEGPEYRGMSGPLRALVYRIGAETGLRVSEIQSLRVGDFALSGYRPTVTVAASTAKNRREASIPLLPNTAREIAPYLRSKLPVAPALPLPRSFRDKATRWLRYDLDRAEIPYRDEAGRIADFHSLRVTFISGLTAVGANPRVIQSLARHATAEMTLSIYAKLGRDDERQALERLPSLSVQAVPETQANTGTHGTGCMAPSVASGGGLDETSGDPSGPSTRPQAPEKAAEASESGGGGGSRTRVPAEGETDTTTDGGGPSGETAPTDEAAYGVQCGVAGRIDPALERLAALWPGLPAAVRSALVAAAEAASGDQS